MTIKRHILNNYEAELKEIKLLDELYLLDSSYYYTKQNKIELLAGLLATKTSILYSILAQDFCMTWIEWEDLDTDEKNFTMQEVEEILSDLIADIVEA